MSPPGWTSDPRLAAVAWSRLTEPSDAVAARVRDHLGIGAAVEIVLGTVALPGCALEPGPHAHCENHPDGRRERLLAQALERWRSRLGPLDPLRDLEVAGRAQAQLVLPGDDLWPGALDDLGVARPVLLWVRGRPAAGPAVALVGSRTCTGYGQRVTSDLAAGLAGHGYDIVSGAAFGIDAVAHRAALGARATTTAVLACGIDRAYPGAHADLIDQIAGAGAVLSESSPGSTPTRWRFLQRNRLIAALAGTTVVVEAAWRSGALNTAHHAAELGRMVGAVPGPVTSAASAGCHRLIRKQLAVCVTGADEVHELTAPLGRAPQTEPHVPARPGDGLGPVDLRVWEALSPGRALTVPQLAVGAGVSPAQLWVVLGRLAGDGLAVRGSGPDGVMTWRRARPG